jgi:drug/metabolite transporter (DMT)-like permease
VIFGEFPNALAIVGIGVIIVTGVLLVMRSGRGSIEARTAINIKQGSDEA